MAWCRQAASHYLDQWWSLSVTLYGVIKPQWIFVHNMPHSPNKIIKVPPMTGSGSVMNSAPNLFRIPSTIMRTADTWTTLRLPTWTGNNKNYSPIAARGTVLIKASPHIYGLGNNVHSARKKWSITTSGYWRPERQSHRLCSAEAPVITEKRGFIGFYHIK